MLSFFRAFSSVLWAAVPIVMLVAYPDHRVGGNCDRVQVYLFARASLFVISSMATLKTKVVLLVDTSFSGAKNSLG